MFGRIHLWSHLVLGFCSLEDFWLVSISMLVMDLIRFCIFSWFRFGRLYFSKNSSISSKLSVLLSYGCWWWFLMVLFISVLSVVISPLSFLILLIWFFSPFFFMSLANGLSILFIFSKNQLLILLIFCYSLLCFFFIYFCSNF